MLNNGVQKAVAENNLVHLWDAFTNIILKDKRFDTTEFADSLAYAKNHMGEKIFQSFDEEQEKPEAEWTKDYWNEQLAALQGNFCNERIERMKKLGRNLYKQRQEQRTAQCADSPALAKKKFRSRRHQGLLNKLKDGIKKSFWRHY